MTAVLYTVDTELSPGLHQRGFTASDNLRVSILGEVADGSWGIEYQMRRLDAHDLKGVFFVEALSSYLYGIDILKRVVDPILTAGHEVQLHVHPEWLRWMDRRFVSSPFADNIKDYSPDDQRRLIELAAEALERAGAPRPTAFRAGNFGASNETLRAASASGLTFDSSYNKFFAKDVCAIRASVELNQPTLLDGILEVPVTHFQDFPKHDRHLQVCAASAAEFRLVARQSLSVGRPTIVIVSHSFELLNRKRTHANRALVERFDRYCAYLESEPLLSRGGFADAGALLRNYAVSAPLRSNPLRTCARIAEQIAGSLRYD